jgi:hypothetical protein
MGLTTAPASLPLALAAISPSLKAPPEPLPREMLVELLKYPVCVGGARRAVLDFLGMHYRRTFADQWDFVRFATEQHLNIDFTSPPKRPEPAAVAPNPAGPPRK